MVISEDLISCVNSILDGILNDVQSNPILLGNPQLPALDDEGRGIDASTLGAGEQW